MKRRLLKWVGNFARKHPRPMVWLMLKFLAVCHYHSKIWQVFSSVKACHSGQSKVYIVHFPVPKSFELENNAFKLQFTARVCIELNTCCKLRFGLFSSQFSKEFCFGVFWNALLHCFSQIDDAIFQIVQSSMSYITRIFGRCFALALLYFSSYEIGIN